MSVARLLKEGPKVVNIGMESFAEELKAQGCPVVAVDWKPPTASGDLLAKLRKLKKGGCEG